VWTRRRLKISLRKLAAKKVTERRTEIELVDESVLQLSAGHRNDDLCNLGNKS